MKFLIIEIIEYSWSVLVLLSFIISLYYFYTVIWKSKSKTRIFLINITLFLMMIVSCTTVLDGAFRFFVVRSDGSGFTLSSKRWFKKYWNPINSQGYRDIEHSLCSLNENKVIFTIGDSFIAGHGIKDYRNRISNILQNLLGEEWTSVVLAKCGWSTDTEFQALRNYKYLPDYLILSYYPNDIEGAAKENGKVRKSERITPSFSINKIINKSHFLNYLYWHIFRQIKMKYFIKDHENTYQSYQDFIIEAYNDTLIWKTHIQELEQFREFTCTNSIPFIVVIFPFMNNLELSKPIIQRITNELSDWDVSVINVIDLVKDMPVKDRIVNSNDSHASVQVHRLVANKLYKEIINLESQQNINSCN